MKKLSFTLTMMLIHFSLLACSWEQISFCNTFDAFPERNVIAGVIVGSDATGIDFEVLEVLRGEVLSDMVRIWDGTDIDCNGIHSLAAADIGAVNDTFLLMLPLITEIENEWDVIGDYRRENPYAHANELKIEQGKINGLIRGDWTFPPPFSILEYPYTEFKNEIINGGDCSSIVISAAPVVSNKTEIKINNPFFSRLKIQLPETINKGYVKVYSINGELLHLEEINYANSINLELNSLHSGIYLLEIDNDNKWRELLKVVKVQ